MILLAGKEELLVLLGDVFGLLRKYSPFVNGWHSMEIARKLKFVHVSPGSPID